MPNGLDKKVDVDPALPVEPTIRVEVEFHTAVAQSEAVVCAREMKTTKDARSVRIELLGGCAVVVVVGSKHGQKGTVD